jgi:hypothetical protein
VLQISDEMIEEGGYLPKDRKWLGLENIAEAVALFPGAFQSIPSEPNFDGVRQRFHSGRIVSNALTRNIRENSLDFRIERGGQFVYPPMSLLHLRKQSLG